MQKSNHYTKSLLLGVSQGWLFFTTTIQVNGQQACIQGKAKVRYLLINKDLGTFTNSFSRVLSLHRAGLCMISPIQ